MRQGRQEDAKAAKREFGVRGFVRRWEVTRNFVRR
jgi:hypothetical protein